jgi:phospholipase/lecithinase/hemolysin
MRRAKLLQAVAAFIFATVVVLTAAPSAGQRYDSLYVFGDSLADNGNVWLASLALRTDPAPPPSISPHRAYFNGRFSNGPVAFEYLWQFLSGQAPGTPRGLRPFLQFPVIRPSDAVDFAFGGTGTPLIDQTPGGLYAPGLKGQVELFRAALGGRKPSNHAAYAIATGANDYRDDQFNQPMLPPDVVHNIADSVVALYQLGARDILVLNLPDLGLLPANRGDPGAATQLTLIHNALLAEAMNAVAAQFPDLHLLQIDLNQVFALLPSAMDRTTPALDFLIPPGSLPPPYPPGFEMSTCLFVDPASCVDAPTFDVGQRFLFWDIVHPTTAAHRVLGNFLYAALAP